MHQNKFHTETIQRLRDKIEGGTKGGQPLDDEDKRLAEHLKILYKFANKGIKGRGKKEDDSSKISAPENPPATTTPPTEPKSTPNTTASPKRAHAQSNTVQNIGSMNQALVLPPPAPSVIRSDYVPSFPMSMANLSWPRENIFISNQNSNVYTGLSSETLNINSGSNAAVTTGGSGYSFGSILG
jgi:hypothetical protein